MHESSYGQPSLDHHPCQISMLVGAPDEVKDCPGDGIAGVHPSRAGVGEGCILISKSHAQDFYEIRSDVEGDGRIGRPVPVSEEHGFNFQQLTFAPEAQLKTLQFWTSLLMELWSRAGRVINRQSAGYQDKRQEPSQVQAEIVIIPFFSEGGILSSNRHLLVQLRQVWTNEVPQHYIELRWEIIAAWGYRLWRTIFKSSAPHGYRFRSVFETESSRLIVDVCPLHPTRLCVMIRASTARYVYRIAAAEQRDAAGPSSPRHHARSAVQKREEWSAEERPSVAQQQDAVDGAVPAMVKPGGVSLVVRGGRRVSQSVQGCHTANYVGLVETPVGRVLGTQSWELAGPAERGQRLRISGASTADILSDEMRYPSFLRTVPKDYYQTKAIMDLIKTFGWNWIGIVVTDDEYGLSSLDLLNSLFKDNGICTAFSRTVSSNVKHPSLQNRLNNVINDLKTSTTKVVIIFAKSSIVAELFRAAIRENISRTWIGSDSWINSNLLASMQDIAKVGTIFGFTFTRVLIPGIEYYLKNLYPPSNGATNEFLNEYKMWRFGCTEEYREYRKCLNSTSDSCPVPASAMHKSPVACTVEDVSLQNDDYLVHNIEIAYSTALSVTAIAQALRNIMCRNGTCDKDLQVSPRKLLAELKNNSFTYNDETFHFNSFGEVLRSYSLFNWQLINKSFKMTMVGRYDTVNQKISINQSLLVWNNINGTVPFSNCTATCKPGYFKKHSFISCCYECIAWADNSYSPMPDMAECFACPYHQWSDNGSSQCENKTIQYLNWNDPFAVTLETFASIGIAGVLLIGILFVTNTNHSSVKAAGGHYAYLLMVSLISSLTSIWFFIGEPNDLICQIRQPLYGISFTIAVNCILIKSILILMAFESAKKGKRIGNFTRQRSIIVVAVLTGAQIVICVLWLILKSPFAMTDNTIPQFILMYCDEGSYVSFGIMLGYIALLAFTCFLLAYKGRKLPDKYNEARCITFSMLVYMFVWILFIPVYKNSRGVYLCAVQIVAILSSVYGVVGCHLLPVCYVILFKQTDTELPRAPSASNQMPRKSMASDFPQLTSVPEARPKSLQVWRSMSMECWSLSCRTWTAYAKVVGQEWFGFLQMAGRVSFDALMCCRDVTKDFIVRQAVKGLHRGQRRPDARRPVTFAILHAVLDQLPHCCSSDFEVSLFRVAFLLAFFGAGPALIWIMVHSYVYWGARRADVLGVSRDEAQ
ncbi:PREDICTED: G-protein coupled receptor family C group 6 member A-like, partial [Nanorana parkeri]|uniref:G-protein coupled receptor family C group 6 member A-like n=1 Tax=Nanorana parkeri TaxID=125878 RepID=UPI0008545A72